MANADRATGPGLRLADRPGRMIVLTDIVGTAVFVVTAFVAAIVFNSPTQWMAAIVALALFLIGIGAFLWSFYYAVQRSRVEQVAVTQLYLHVGGIVPRHARLPMLACLLVQTAVGLLTAFWRANAEDGSPGTSLALGVLVPMFGFGLNGLWAAYHGRFEPRQDEAEHGTGDAAVDGDAGVDDAVDEDGVDVAGVDDAASDDHAVVDSARDGAAGDRDTKSDG